MTRLVAIMATLAATLGCGTTYEQDIEPVFVRSCAAVECHSGDPADESGLDLSLGNGYASIVGQPSQQSNLNLIEAGDPATSYLWLKINDTHGEFDLSEGGSDPMPPVGGLGVNELATIEKWITDGAAE